ncbi:MAG: hypothetical protein ACJAXJ_002954 [Colwellia sp.]|jgi:hypothetical protein
MIERKDVIGIFNPFRMTTYLLPFGIITSFIPVPPQDAVSELS